MGKIFFILFAVYFTLNAGTLAWFWRALRGTAPARWVVCLALLALMLFFPLLYRRSGDSWLEAAALEAGCWWIGSFVYVAALILAAEGMNFLAARFRDGGRFESPKLAFAVLAVAFVIALAGRINAAFPVLREKTLRVVAAGGHSDETPPPPVTLAVISDLHLGRVNGVGVLSRVVDLLAPHSPDAVLLLGDVLDDHVGVDEAGLRRELARLTPPLGVWGILGNHEYHAGRVDESVEMLERAGIRILRDEAAVAGGRIALAGRDDLAGEHYTQTSRRSLPDILTGLSADERRLPLVVLDHQPRAPRDAEAAGAVLQMSGHTHNGQLWPYNHVVARVYENGRGWSERDGTHTIVTIGAGTWGPPLRNNARPEVWLIRLEFTEPR